MRNPKERKKEGDSDIIAKNNLKIQKTQIQTAFLKNDLQSIHVLHFYELCIKQRFVREICYDWLCHEINKVK